MFACILVKNINKKPDHSITTMAIKEIQLKKLEIKTRKENKTSHVHMWKYKEIVPDIARNEYTKDHLSRECLKDMKSLPIFIDDFYVFGCFSEKQCVRKKIKDRLQHGKYRIYETYCCEKFFNS